MSKPLKDSITCTEALVIDSENTSSLHRQLCDNLFDGVYFVDKDRQISYWNRGAEELTGYAAAEVRGSHCFENLLMHVDDAGCELCHAGCPLAATILDGRRREAEVYLRHKSGHRIPVSVRVAPITDKSGEIVGAVEVFSDISAKKGIERRAKNLEADAYLDVLTGVSNRRYIEMAIEHTVQEAERFGIAAGILLIDVDHFKKVNDEFGHKVGDAVLKTVAETLTHILRPQDIVGRWGGDEFLMIAKNVDLLALEKLGARCRRLIEASEVQTAGERITVTVSIGGTLLEPGRSAEDVFQIADGLLYQSKAQGRNRTTVAGFERADQACLGTRTCSGFRQPRAKNAE